MTNPPALIVFGGLPGTGKTTVSRELTRRLTATYLRVDAIERTLKALGLAVGPMGYVIANALAAENLKLGRLVIADCVNPVLESRVGWQQTASQNSACIVEIELVCSDLDLHRRRVEKRLPDIASHKLPTWDEVLHHQYDSWDQEHLVLDTASGSLNDLVDRAEVYARSKIAVSPA